MSNVAEILQEELNEMKISRITGVESNINKSCIECFVMEVGGMTYLVSKDEFEKNKVALINGTLSPAKVTELKCPTNEWFEYIKNDRITTETIEVNDPSKPIDNIITAIF